MTSGARGVEVAGQGLVEPPHLVANEAFFLLHHAGTRSGNTIAKWFRAAVQA